MLERVEKLGYKLGLAQRLSPSAYDRSLKKLISEARIQTKEHILDVESSDGSLPRLLRSTLPRKMANYVGIDHNERRIVGAQKLTRDLALASYCEFIHTPGLSVFPLVTDSMDVAFVHMALFRLSPHIRYGLLREMRRIVRDDGRILLMEPTANYNAETVIDSSKVHDRFLGHLPQLSSIFNQTLGYRLMKRRAQQAVNKLNQSSWQAYDKDTMATELSSAGFKLDWAATSEDDLFLLAGGQPIK
jgi:ubiquinone/menaquinone biosynthesis C-methylase UbiE